MKIDHKQFIDLSQPSLEGLAYMLQHKHDLIWEFYDCNHCAMGLAAQVWGIQPNLTDMADVFNLDANSAFNIFMKGTTKDNIISPITIVNRINKYLAND